MLSSTLFVVLGKNKHQKERINKELKADGCDNDQCGGLWAKNLDAATRENDERGGGDPRITWTCHGCLERSQKTTVGKTIKSTAGK